MLSGPTGFEAVMSMPPFGSHGAARAAWTLVLAISASLAAIPAAAVLPPPMSIPAPLRDPIAGRGVEPGLPGTWSAEHAMPCLDGDPAAIADWNGTLVVVGAFRGAGTDVLDGAALWDGTRWRPVGEGPGPGGTAVAAVGRHLLVAGPFETSAVRLWNGHAWRALGRGLRARGAGIRRILDTAEGTMVFGDLEVDEGATARAGHLAMLEHGRWRLVDPSIDDRLLAAGLAGGRLVVATAGASAAGPQALRVRRAGGWDPLATLPDERDEVADVIGWGDRVAVIGRLFEPGVDRPEIPVLWLESGRWGTEPGVHGTASLAAATDLGLMLVGWLSLDDSGRWTRGLRIAAPGSHASFYPTPDARCLAAWNGGLVVGSMLAPLDVPASEPALARVAAYDGARWRWLEDPGPGAGLVADAGLYGVVEVDQLASVNDTLYACGWFDRTHPAAGWSLVGSFVRWDADHWEPATSQPTPDPVTAFTWYRGMPVVSVSTNGWFGPEFGLWTWAGYRWIDLAPGLIGPPSRLAVSRGDLIAAGFPIGVRGYPHAELVLRWDGSQWSVIGEGTSASWDVVTGLLVFEDRLIVAGRFTSIGGVPVPGIAAWDGTAWSPLGEGVGDVTALAVEGGRLVAGTSGAGLFAWDGASWTRFGDAGGTIRGITALSAHDGVLDVAGSFVAAGAVAEPGDYGIHRWDGRGWARIGRVDGAVRALAFHRGAVWAAGAFGRAGDRDAANVAHFTESRRAPPPPAPPAELGAPRPSPLRERATIDLALAEDARVSVEVFDVAGRRVRTLAEGRMTVGVHALEWDGRTDAGTRVAPGLYLARAIVNGRAAAVGRIVVIR